MSGQRADSTAGGQGWRRKAGQLGKDLGLGAPWCNAGFRCSIKVLTGHAAHDETGRNPRSECSSECSACTAEAGRLPWPYRRQSGFGSSNRDSPPHAASRFEEGGPASEAADGRHSLLPRGVQRAIY